MLSLGNARSAEELEAWEARIRNLLKRFDIEAGEISYVTEPKIDGLAISLTYEDGVSSAGRPAATAGSARTSPRTCARSARSRCEFRRPSRGDRGQGRDLLPRSGFERLNAERAEAGLPAFANPRNAAAGTIRQQDPALAAERPLQIWRTGSVTAAASTTHPQRRAHLAARARLPGQRQDHRSPGPAPRWSPAASGGSGSGRASTTRSTAPSSRSTTAGSGASSVSSGGSRATRSPGSSRR